MFKNIICHFKTITHHRHQVMLGCFKVGLYKQGLFHDLSKYSPIEFFNSVKYYTGQRSPIYYERKKYGYSKTYLHHKSHNKHHFEYWYDPYARGASIMPDNYIVESVIDRITAAKIYSKENYYQEQPYEYFLKDHCVTDLMPKNIQNKFAYILKYLADNGEDKLYKYLKLIVKNGYFEW